jgi:5'-3' exonuclease
MGIKDFYKHLKTKHPECFQPVEYSMFQYQRIAIDMMNLLYVYKARDERHWLRRLLEFMIYLRERYVHPICVFDGESHPLKHTTVEKRKNDRERGRQRVDLLSKSVEHFRQTGEQDTYMTEFLETHPEFVSKLTGRPILSQFEYYLQRQGKNYSLQLRTVEVEAVKELLEAMGIVVLVAEYDGEALCSYLSASGQVDVVVSNDSDVFFFGCHRVLFKFTEQGGYLVHYKDILKGLDITSDEFVDLCLLCGTDFNTSIRGIGFCRALALVQQYKSIHNPQFPYRTQLDFDLLDQIRIMRKTNIENCCGYTRPIQPERLEQLLFKHQIEGLSIQQWKPTEIQLVE